MIEENIKIELLKYGIEVFDVQLFKDGTLRSTYKIKSRTEEYVVKLYDFENEEKIQEEISCLRKIRHKSGRVTIYPLNEKVIKFGNMVGYYYDFFNGKKISDYHLENIHYRFGQLAGNLDMLLSELSFKESGHTTLFLLAQLSAAKQNLEMICNERIKSLINKGFVLIDKEIKNLDFSKIRRQFIHKDLHFDNVIYDPIKDQFFIIDTSGLSVNFLPREIAVIIANEFWLNNEINYHAIQRLLKGYNEVIQLTKSELSSIVLFMINKKIGELLFLQIRFRENKLSKSMYKKYMSLSSNNLEALIKNYADLKRLFENTIF